MIGSGSEYVNKIVIDNSFYNCVNPFVQVKKTDTFKY
jgi:hypothetical protein